jgi:hypothetical protein
MKEHKNETDDSSNSVQNDLCFHNYYKIVKYVV